MHVMPHFLHSELASEYKSGLTKRTSVYVPGSTMADCLDCLTKLPLRHRMDECPLTVIPPINCDGPQCSTKLLLDRCVNERQICGISA